MKRVLLILLAVCAGLTLIGCEAEPNGDKMKEIREKQVESESKETRDMHD